MRSLLGLSPQRCGFSRGVAFWIVALLLASAANSSAKDVARVTEYPVPTADSDPLMIAPGPDGALWFTELGVTVCDPNCVVIGKIGRITTSGVVTEYPTPTVYSGPSGITAGPDGAMWFTEYYANKIGRITTSGTITEYTVSSSAQVSPLGITAGPDGALWFTEYGSYYGTITFGGNKIGRITTSGEITEYPVPTAESGPGGITAGPDGALWFTEGLANNIGRITTSGEITEYPVPTANSAPGAITAGPDGALWFTQTGYIGRITTSGETKEYPTTAGGGGVPYGITVGPDGALWFTLYGGYIGRIKTSGKMTEYSTSAGGIPEGITAGPDGALWFANWSTSTIGQVVLPVSPLQRFARPIPMGVSVSNTPSSCPDCYAGTAGLLVDSVGAPTSKFILSNNHVLGAVGPTLCPSTATVGRTWTLQPGTLDIVRPGTRKTGWDPLNDPDYQVGVVANFWQLSKKGKNLIDAALSSTNPAWADSEILGIGQPKAAMRSAALYEGVVKSGRTTGVTVGTVTDINCTITVDYEECGSYTFASQIAIFGVSPGAFSNQPDFEGNPFSRGGDSGSAVLDAGTSTPVGLLFAGDPLLTYANLISAVYSSFRVVTDGPGGGGPSPEEELKAMDDLMQETLDPRLAGLKEIQARHEDQLLSLEGVAGICISLDESGHDFVFRVHVTKRTPELEQAIPREIEGVPVWLVETGGPIKAY